VAEGFSCVMTNAVQRNMFKCFKVKHGGTIISHLQYPNDTFLYRGCDNTKYLDLEGFVERF